MTNRQRRFVDEYLIDLNGTQAAIRAGYSPSTASVIAAENLVKPNISAAISRAMADRSKRTGINADRVLEELAKIGFANAEDIVANDGSIRPDAVRDDLAAVQSVKDKRIPTKEGIIIDREIKLCDKLRALELLGKHLGLFTEKFQVEGNVQIVFAEEDALE